MRISSTDSVGLIYRLDYGCRTLKRVYRTVYMLLKCLLLSLLLLNSLPPYLPMVPRTTAITSITKQRIPKATAMGRQQGDVAQVPRKPEGTEIK